jgi:hypothetical protein
MSDEERESDLGEWCSEHREFYTEGTPCPGCKVIREAYIRGAKDALAELMRRWNSGQMRLRAHEALIREIKRGEWPKEE